MKWKLLVETLALICKTLLILSRVVCLSVFIWFVYVSSGVFQFFSVHFFHCVWKKICTENAVFAHLTLYPKVFCHFHYQAYYELTIAYSPVGLLSSMDRALRLVITNIKPEFFQVLFRPLRLFTLLQWSLSYLYPQFKILFVLYILIQVISTNGYLMNSQWPVLQLAWWAQWMELCIQSLQRSGFDFWSSLNLSGSFSTAYSIPVNSFKQGGHVDHLRGHQDHELIFLLYSTWHLNVIGRVSKRSLSGHWPKTRLISGALCLGCSFC